MFRKHFTELQTALSTLEALIVCMYLYSAWVIEEEELLEVLNDKTLGRNEILMNCTLMKIKDNPECILNFFNAIEEITVLTSLIRTMKQEYCGGSFQH